jgi:uncharacterized protein (DUF169 family)
MDIVRRLDDCFKEYLRTATFPVAVKISQDTALPPEVKRPSVTFGYPLNICQGIAMVRRYGWVMGYLKEDHACAAALVALGIVEEPDFIKDGSFVYPLYTETLEMGEKTQKASPKMPLGQIQSIIMAPLHKARFNPDLVIIYGNPGQMVRLIQGALYTEGGTIESHFMGKTACGSEIVTPLLSGKCNVIIPGGGEKVFAQTGDDEMAFAVPRGKIEGLIKGLTATHKTGIARIPTPYYGLRIQPKFPEEYRDLQEHCGL